MSVCVIGAGVMGLSTAVYLQKIEPRAKVTLVADKFSADTTSALAAGHWRPIFLPDPREDLLKRWAMETYQFIENLFIEDSVKYGAGRVSGYELYCTQQEIPYWMDCVVDFRRVGSKELERMGWGQFKDGFFFSTYYLECKRYLPVLLEKFRSNGGIVQQKKLTNLTPLANTADVIVNCSGLGAYHLLQDESCFPIRGQVFKVHAPFVKHFLIADDYYILPNHEVVTLGGTHQEGDWRTTIDTNDSIDIWKGTTSIWPSLKYATVMEERAGLRPGRPTIRLELENIQIGNKSIPVVHNYGHGGSGISLHHGCACDAADLAKQALHRKINTARL